MEFIDTSFQLSVFADINYETATDLAKCLLEYDFRLVPTNQPIINDFFINLANVKSSTGVAFSKNRIDYAFQQYDTEKIDKFVDDILMLDKIKNIGNISRLALNYNFFIKDDNDVNKKIFADHFNFSKDFGELKDVFFRINHNKIVDNLVFNTIVTCQNSSMQNVKTLENIKCVAFHFDINNVSVSSIERPDLKKFFKEMEIISCETRDKVEKILNERK